MQVNPSNHEVLKRHYAGMLPRDIAAELGYTNVASVRNRLLGLGISPNRDSVRKVHTTRALVLKLHSEGKTPLQIADELGYAGRHTVYQHLRRSGVKRPPTKKEGILPLHNQGMTPEEIAEELEFSDRSCVDKHLRAWGLKPNWKPTGYFWTEEQDQLLTKLRLETKLTLEEIAKQVGHSRKACGNRVAILKLPCTHYNGFSQEDDDAVVRLRKEGLSYSQIGARLGRSRSSIAGRLQRLRKAGVSCV